MKIMSYFEIFLDFNTYKLTHILILIIQIKIIVIIKIIIKIIIIIKFLIKLKKILPIQNAN